MFSSVHSTMKNGKKISKNAIKCSVFNDFQSRIFSHFVIANNYNYLLVFCNKSKLQKKFHTSKICSNVASNKQFDISY